MTHSPIQIARQMYEQLFDGPLRQQFSVLGEYLEKEGSVCVLAQKGVGGLVSEYGMSVQQARAFQERINGLATQVVRRFIEYRLADEEAPVQPSAGLNSGPNYSLLFNPKFHEMCPPSAIEAIHSPAAYLVCLMHWALHRLGAVDGTALPLTERRPDLEALWVDTIAVNGTVSSVEVITRVMEAFIESKSGATQNIDKDLSERFFPNTLPFHTPWETLDYVTRRCAESVGSVVRLCDPSFPYFIRPIPWGTGYDKAFTQAARLSPAQQVILTEAIHEGEDGIERFYPRYFGLSQLLAGNLRHVSVFNERTKLDYERLEALLSIEGFSTGLSENVSGPGFMDTFILPVSGVHAGSVFIHKGINPPISIKYGEQGQPDIFNFFENVTLDRFDRMNRKLRLDTWLELPSHEVDAVIVAAMNAEERSVAAPTYEMTANTIRALGLFQELREQFACTAEDFAAFFGVISIFGRGTEKAQFDRIFNEHAGFPKPFKIDDVEFPIIPVSDADWLTVKQLRRGLGIDLETYFYLAYFVAGAHEVSKLARSLPIVSSFYRMARLPRLLGITPIQGVLLLGILGGETWVASLAGAPRTNTNRSVATPDALTVIHGLMDCVRWCRDAELPVHWVIEQVTPIMASALPTDAQLNLFTQLQVQLLPVLFTEQALIMVGVPTLSNNRQWLDVLRALVDKHGLIVHFAETPEQSYESYAREMIDRAVSAAIGGIDDDARLIIVEKILAVILRSEAGQRNVVQGSLGAHAELASERVLPVLTWSGSTVYGVLTEVLTRLPVAADSTTRRQAAEVPGDPFLSMLAEFARRSNVATTLELSAGFLMHFTQVGYQRWFGLQAVQEFSLSTLYYLTVYKRAVKAVTLTGQSEEKLLDYLTRVNALPDNLDGDGKVLVQERAAKMLAELLAWSVQEVRACANHVNPTEGFIRTLAQLDVLTRIRAFARRSGLDAETILDVAGLNPDSAFEVYESVADRVSASLSESADPTLADDVEAIDLDVQVECVVSKPQLVANHPTDFATYTVTVQNRAGAKQKSVNVHWRSGLGRFESPMVTTDNLGVATVKFYPGPQMGTAVPSLELELELGLGQAKKRVAPNVVIGPERSSLDLDTDNPFPEPPGPVLLGTRVTYRATVMDQYKNRFVGERVGWKVDPIAQVPIEILTNSQGVAELTFTSDEEAEVKVEAKVGNASLYFWPIKFVQELP
ncbi:Insecticidal toxin complex/plasmid viulence protein [Pseudomonas sp. GM41(2012)]|uniref:Tc toxin subunit A n=1 Tax=Pseudomonas sp. (strain GM41(2012)) TaxID=1144708 RepID=UPI00027029B8|nr:Tc toxin subunit A [Pseudomonas sp. GM41(2012)]EUB71192.1 Insecticidal toxin complex/plasmid viulence protein [Pseudomonas sp. GM41(2012)]